MAARVDTQRSIWNAEYCSWKQVGETEVELEEVVGVQVIMMTYAYSPSCGDDLLMTSLLMLLPVRRMQRYLLRLDRSL